MIRLDLTTKRFGSTQVLGPMTLTVGKGEILAVTGASGVGKTTLLRILGGLDGDFDGTVEKPERMAMVFQEPTLLPWRTARDNICLATDASAGEADACLKDVGLEGMGDRFPGQLSLGQKRRLALARAFAAKPDVLLLDEPFVSLDEALAKEMVALTARLLEERGVTAILVTHTAREAARLANRTIRLEGSPARIQPAD
jgi:NitT/TauT family transport system ATP-binding protein